jgi:hypothetical protein
MLGKPGVTPELTRDVRLAGWAWSSSDDKKRAAHKEWKSYEKAIGESFPPTTTEVHRLEQAMRLPEQAVHKEPRAHEPDRYGERDDQ